MLTQEMTNWLGSNDTEDYKAMVVVPPFSTESERAALMSGATLDVFRRREIINNFMSAFNISSIEETISIIGDWQDSQS
jgi:hypothetical protein